MSFAIGWLKKENYPFEHYFYSDVKCEIIMYFDEIGKAIYNQDYITIKLGIFESSKYNSLDEMIYFKAVEAYNKFEKEHKNESSQSR